MIPVLLSVKSWPFPLLLSLLFTKKEGYKVYPSVTKICSKNDSCTDPAAAYLARELKKHIHINTCACMCKGSIIRNSPQMETNQMSQR